MSDGFIWLHCYNFTHERILYMPNGHIYANELLYEDEWNRIDSTIKDML